MPGVKIKGKYQIVGGLGRNREVYVKSVSQTFMSRKTCQVYIVTCSKGLKGGRMGRSDTVSLWCVSLLINTRFRFLC